MITSAVEMEANFFHTPMQWLILKKSTIASVDYPPVEIFRGSAAEVDKWCQEHSHDPLFTDKYTSKYAICHDGELK